MKERDDDIAVSRLNLVCCGRQTIDRQARACKLNPRTRKTKCRSRHSIVVPERLVSIITHATRKGRTVHAHGPYKATAILDHTSADEDNKMQKHTLTSGTRTSRPNYHTCNTQGQHGQRARAIQKTLKQGHTHKHVCTHTHTPQNLKKTHAHTHTPTHNIT